MLHKQSSLTATPLVGKNRGGFFRNAQGFGIPPGERDRGDEA